jgi:hypothetical protein
MGRPGGDGAGEQQDSGGRAEPRWLVQPGGATAAEPATAALAGGRPGQHRGWGGGGDRAATASPGVPGWGGERGEK